MSSVVYQEVSNNFTHKDQKIVDRDIVAVLYSPLTPADSSVLPSRVGEMYIQISEGTTDKKTRAWISVVSAGSTFKWEELMVVHDLPDTVAQTSKANHFEPWEQTIAGHQILSFVDGGDQTPEQSLLPADYNGQFYIAVKKLSDGKNDVSVWVAHGNQWLPIIKETVDTSNFAKLDTSNVFDSAIQLLGPAEHTRMISATRIKRDRAPIADASWKAMVEGEKTIYINDATTPAEISIWTAVKVNTGSTNAGEWVMTWSSNGSGGTLPDDVAYTSKPNMFVPLQQMGDASNTVFLTGARMGVGDPTGTVVPLAFGEIYIRTPSPNNYEFYIAAEEADTDSWMRLYDNGVVSGFNQRLSALEQEDRDINGRVTAVDTRVTNLENEDTTVHQRIDVLDTDLDNLAITVGQIDSDVTALDTDLNIVKNNVTLLDGRVNTVETAAASLDLRVTELEGHKDSHASQLAAHDTTLDAVVANVASLTTSDGNQTTLITGLRTDLTAAQTQIDANKADNLIQAGQIDSLQTDLITESVRIDALETASHTFVGLTDTPNTLTPDKLLLVNGTGDRIVETTITGTELTQMKSNVASLISSDGSQSTLINNLRTDLTAAQTQINANTSANSTQAGQIDNLQIDLANEIIRIDALAPLYPKVTALETKMTAEESATADHEARIGVLESVPNTFVGLTDTPNTLTANKLLAVNAAGNALTETTQTVQDLGNMMILNAGVVTGNSLINAKSIGCDTALTGGDISQTYFCSSNVAMGSPASGQTKIVSMGEIAPYESTVLTATQYREGCIKYVINLGAGVLRLTPPSGSNIMVGSTDSSTYDIPAGRGVAIFPAVYDNGTKKYIIISMFRTTSMP